MIKTILCLAMLFLNNTISKQLSSSELPTLSKIDIKRYSGTWFEIARLPNSFENGLKCITATYNLRKDGKIDVLNSGHQLSDPAKINSAHGKAWIPDPKFPGRLKVQFFWPFSGDYYIIQLDENYQYVLVGDPSRKYLWILCRTKLIEPVVYDRLVEKAKILGFDIEKLVTVPQDCK